jgi:hypothetical protein
VVTYQNLIVIWPLEINAGDLLLGVQEVVKSKLFQLACYYSWFSLPAEISFYPAYHFLIVVCTGDCRLETCGFKLETPHA